jgi:DNA-binding MarR family transcriptional regulator
VLLCIAHNPDVRLREIASTLGISERRAYDIVNDLTQAGYVTKERNGRRNRYQVLTLSLLSDREEVMGEVLDLIIGRSGTSTSPGRAQ